MLHSQCDLVGLIAFIACDVIGLHGLQKPGYMCYTVSSASSICLTLADADVIVAPENRDVHETVETTEAQRSRPTARRIKGPPAKGLSELKGQLFFQTERVRSCNYRSLSITFDYPGLHFTGMNLTSLALNGPVKFNGLCILKTEQFQY